MVKALKRWTPYRDWNELDVVLTLEQVCAILRITEPTARKLLRSGEIPGVQLGTQWRISRDALRQVLGEAPEEPAREIRVKA